MLENPGESRSNESFRAAALFSQNVFLIVSFRKHGGEFQIRQSETVQEHKSLGSLRRFV